MKNDDVTTQKPCCLDSPTVSPENLPKEECKGSEGEKRVHCLLTSPPTPGQDGRSHPGLLGPPPPVSTEKRCPPLQIWPPAQLAPSTSEDADGLIPNHVIIEDEDTDGEEEIDILISDA